MSTLRFIVVSLILMLAWNPLPVRAATLNVTTSAQLTSALGTAVAGDTILLADGTYPGQFTINGNAGTSTNKITIRAANRHQAVLVGDNVCDRFHQGLVVQRQWWIVKDLKFRDHGRAVSIETSNVEISNVVIDHYLSEAIRIDGANPGTATGSNIHDSVIAHGDVNCANPTAGETAVAVFIVNNADSNSFVNNLVIGTGDNGYQCGGGGGCSVGDKGGYGLRTETNVDGNLFQGNLFLANGGKGIFRLFAPDTPTGNTTSGNIVRDNTFLWGEGGVSFDDCTDDSDQFLNNISLGNYTTAWLTKGNLDGTKGHHIVRHNLLALDDFAHMGTGMWTGGSPFCANSGGFSYKIANTFQDNLLYSTGVLNGLGNSRVLMDQRGPTASIYTTIGNNLFWAPGATSTWTNGYTFQASDVHATGSQPLFANPGIGDFSLTAGSPGKAAASDSTDMGVTYNAYLKKTWLARAFTLPTQQNTGLSGVTTTSFAVNPTRFHQVWFYLPNTPCAQTAEQFTIEGVTAMLQRDITVLNSSTDWVQAGGPARWITLGRHKAGDGTLNVAWQHANCVEAVFIRELPTADEIFQWIVAKGAPRHKAVAQ